MAPLPWKPLRFPLDLEQLERQIDEMFSSLIDEPWGRKRGGGAWEPAIDLYESDDAYFLEADLPGVLPSDVEIKVEGNDLLISGKRATAQLTQSAHGLRVERRHGSFSRRFRLEHPVDAARIECGCQEGIYHCRLPKKGTE